MAPAEDTVVTATKDGDVGLVVLDRADAMNAITVELGRQLGEAFTRLAEDVRVILVRGAGGNFSVGGDFHEVQRLRAEGPEALVPLFENFGRACSAIADLPVPVVAAVEGYAMAGGFELMQACDVVLVRADAKIADNHANFGQVPGGGGSQRLPRLVGHQRALGHILSGDRMSGAQAEAWGLAYRSFTPDDFEVGVAEFVASIAKKDRDVLVKIKRLVRDGLRMPLNQGLAWERETVVQHIGGGTAAAAGIDGFTRKERA
ncbi:enoyl-CoA hydratase/isomerase family protein [Amycolatopsis sp. NPDC049691]|uniref:enoyl-CoA hydratase/isomerase family protein n=1 Tax=Amycolatopsis sp. NPDC049691 TaxID=3155155 RepID=UPI00341C2E21